MSPYRAVTRSSGRNGVTVHGRQVRRSDRGSSYICTNVCLVVSSYMRGSNVIDFRVRVCACMCLCASAIKRDRLLTEYASDHASLHPVTSCRSSREASALS